MSNFQYVDLIGIPFKYGGRGPDTYDCWGLVMELQKRQGITVPDYASTNDFGKIAAMMAVGIMKWEKVEPTSGVVVAIRIPDANGVSAVRHVGTVLTNGRLIHTWEKTHGVTIERLETWKRRIAGFYAYVG